MLTILVLEHNPPHTFPRPHAHACTHPRPRTLCAAHPRPHLKQVDLTAPTLLMLTQPELSGCVPRPLAATHLLLTMLYVYHHELSTMPSMIAARAHAHAMLHGVVPCLLLLTDYTY